MLANAKTVVVAAGALVGLTACGGTSTPAKGSSGTAAAAAKPADPAAQFGPLDIGADYQTYKKVTKHPHLSPTHGKRFVEIWVNDVGYPAYTSEAEFPVGTIIVKESWESAGDGPSETRGPIFVMEKKAAGFDPEHEDWYYAIHWEKPTPKYEKKLGGPIYWRTPSKKVNYCWGCHENYDREVGLPPREARTWEEPSDDDDGDGADDSAGE